MVASLLGLALAASSTVAGCRPLGPNAEVLAVVTPAMPELEPATTLARALVASSAPFLIASEARTAEALTAERGLKSRQGRVRAARDLLERADHALNDLEDKAALALVAEATPILVAVQAEPEAVQLLARAHLLAGAIYLARGSLDAASRRLQRALDLDPGVAPPASLGVLGALEAIRARAALRGRGWLEVRLAGTATAADVFFDGRRLGRAPGRFESLPEGRHLVRVTAPEHGSFAGTVSIEAGLGAELAVQLLEDEVLALFRRLGSRLAAGMAVDEAQAQLTQRASVERTLLAAVVPAETRAPDGGLEPALVVDLEHAGRVRTPDLSRESVRATLLALARCEAPDSPTGTSLAPALAGPARPGVSATAPRPAEPAWASPWFWVLAAAAAVGLAAGLAATHGESAPPTDVAITLVPRP